MTTKEYLSRYRWQNDSINAKLEQVAELRRKAQTVCSGSSDGTHSSTPYDRIGEITARIVDLEREINEDIDRSIDVQREIRAAIARVTDERLQSLLEYKYINGYTLEEIAVRMDYSYPQICRLHGRALQSVKDDME
jgi:DNA-directed RNA polymerase specialized sigma subunit